MIYLRSQDALKVIVLFLFGLLHVSAEGPILKQDSGGASLEKPSWSAWAAWSPCTEACGNGTTSRERTCSGAKSGMTCNGSHSETKSCIGEDCPHAPPLHIRQKRAAQVSAEVRGTEDLRPGQWGRWTAWSVCSVSCDSGTQMRSRQCGGSQCRGQRVNNRNCREPACSRARNLPGGFATSIRCRYDRSKPKNLLFWLTPKGEMITYRKKNRRYVMEGTLLAVKHGLTRESGNYRCVVIRPFKQRSNRPRPAPSPQWSGWGGWSACSASCGDGTSYRRRACPSRRCPGRDSQSRSCRTRNCPRRRPAPTPQWSGWGGWSACSASCGDGTTYRRRGCPSRRCPGRDSESRSCRTRNCPQRRPAPAPQWSGWGGWSACSASCGDGTANRRRACPSRRCPGSDSGSRSCRTRNCPPPRQAAPVPPPLPKPSWTAWAGWSTCSEACGTGSTSRSRTCTGGTPGRPCKGLNSESKSCIGDDCPKVQAPETPPKIASPPVVKPAPPVKKLAPPVVKPAPPVVNPVPKIVQPPSQVVAQEVVEEVMVAGTWGSWSGWSVCSVSCDSGTQLRFRKCFEDTPAAHTKCQGESTISQACVKSPCDKANSEPGVDVPEGLTANLHCSYDESKPVSKIYWLSPNGELITSKTKNPRYKVDGADLSIQHVEGYDTGTYKCVIVRPNGKANTGEASLDVAAKKVDDEEVKDDSELGVNLNVQTCEKNNPCKNGATCVENGDSPQCTCRDGFKGQYCGEKTSPGSQVGLIIGIVISALGVLGGGLYWFRMKNAKPGEPGEPGEGELQPDVTGEEGTVPWENIENAELTASKQSLLRKSSSKTKDQTYQAMLNSSGR